MKLEFLNLGKQPIANGFLLENEFKNEFLFNLVITYDTNTHLVSLKTFVDPTLVFNETYPYKTSNSFPMVTHFKNIAINLLNTYTPHSVLEIGSNDGPFISNFDKNNSICVEPCGNFSKITSKMGYKTYTQFWTHSLSTKLKSKHGSMDLIYAANCICHIHDLIDTFNGIKNILSTDGIFVFEDPSILQVISRTSYDQFYDEHPHIFSVTALNNLLNRAGLTIFKVDNLSVHGGSNRIYAKHSECTSIPIDKSVELNLKKEQLFGITDIKTYQKFAIKVQQSKDKLLQTLINLKQSGNRILSIGATAKSTTVFNYCGINDSLIELITDTTSDKQNQFSPGMHIPVVPRNSIDITEFDYAYLGAWNFKNVIIKNESKFVENGGKFITHVPNVHII